MIGRIFLFTGVALVAASAVRGLVNLLQADPFDPWSVVLAVGCISASVGLGMTGSKPWKSIEEKAKDIESRFQ